MSSPPPPEPPFVVRATFTDAELEALLLPPPNATTLRDKYAQLSRKESKDRAAAAKQSASTASKKRQGIPSADAASASDVRPKKRKASEPFGAARAPCLRTS
jgi:hypothetical protein